MVETAQKFDVYDNKGKKVADAQVSPVPLSGLTASTKYSGYQAAYAGSTAKVTIPDFTTAIA